MNSLQLSNLPSVLYITEEFMHNVDHDTLLFTLESSRLTESSADRCTESACGSLCVVEIL